MNVNDPNLREILAGEYVLGTLRGAARRQFEKDLAKDPLLRRLVEDWEAKFAPLVEALPPVEPPARVWRAVESRLGEAAEKKTSWWSRIEFWRPFGMAASTALALLLIYVGVQPPHRSIHPRYVSVLMDQKSHPMFMVKVMPATKEIVAQVINPPVMGPDRSCELWMLPGKDQAPISMGLLPMQGRKTMKLSDPMFEKLTKSSGLAVSMEPAGGSPTGVPTGPVMYQGSLMDLG
jgi:anti-sigma-K factor RskA